ncbi:AraC-type DNA-binding protein [Rubritalea squalenifaciens DSM 18772]|uniref:AraC-type DNA-binding protein n=1 Tax=Rubritalea squalenifaciens DSM 18772 TaxID=1123071 RepID=A0A1M6QKF0_9BACT|nr:AraC-type DNA-binding protein [Rubritalea squalenifaciens DSM 18772]
MLKPLSDDEFLRSSIDLDRFSGRSRLGKVIYKPNGYWSPRVSISYELFGILSGSAELEIDGKTIPVLPGEVALVRPGVHVHRRFSSSQDTHQFWISFLPEVITPELAQLAAEAPVKQAYSKTFQHLLDAGYSVHKVHTPAASMFIDQLAVTALSEYIRMANYTPVARRISTPMHKAVDYIEEHYAEEDCLQQAIAASGVTDRHLIKTFNKEMQLTPSRFLWKLRTIRGIELLRETGLTVSEIAYQCGFKSPYHFSRLVKEQQGKSPRDLRNEGTVS